jgi:hypothetical protein
MALDVGLRIRSEGLGLGRLDANPPGSNDAASRFLQENHEKWHMFFRVQAGHNHIPHAILSTLAMGGSPENVQRAYDDGKIIQRPTPPVDPEVVKEMSDAAKFRAHMQVLDEYPNYVAFFKQEIANKGGNWQAVVTDFCFSRTPFADFMLAQLFEGLYHPFIHLGFGIEFELSSLVAEGLAQAASHDPTHLDAFFQRAEALAVETDPAQPRTALVELYREAHANRTIATAARVSDGPWRVRDGVLGRAREEMARLAAQFRVKPTDEDVERATAKMISCAAWMCASAHKPGKAHKLDFFLMHCVTSSLFCTVLGRQPWISIADKARLVEWKTRLDLVWYAACGAPELHGKILADYEPAASKGMDWRQLYHALNAHHDDGHVAKFVRAIKNGEQVAAPFENEPGAEHTFPVRGDAWLKVAQICFDSTTPFDTIEKKWVWGVGFDAMWNEVPDFVTADMNK